MPAGLGRGWVPGVLAGTAVAVVLVLSVLPFGPTGTVVIGEHNYAYETEELFGSHSFLTYSFRGVNFTFHLWCATGPASGVLCGNATEAGGARFSYSFGDGPPTLGPSPWQTWIAPDSQEGVQYQQGGHARLLVALS